MAAYILRRVLQIFPTMLIISMIVFLLLTMKPGDPLEELRRGNPNMTVEDLNRLKSLYGLDQPWYIQYWYWLGRAVQGDFGPSRSQGIPAAQYVFEDALPKTLLLSGLSLLVAFVIAIPMGVLTSIRQHSLFDYGITFINFVGVSIPVFWFGILLIYFFSVKWNILPAGKLKSPDLSVQTWDEIVASTGGGFAAIPPYLEAQWTLLKDRIAHLILPVFALSTLQMAAWTRFMRSSMLEVMNLDYIRTARAKGLSERVVIIRHQMRNAILPIVTLVALAVPLLMSGAVLTETVFSWPGMGLAILRAVQENDFNVAMVSLLFISILILLFNLIADIVYALIDPRIRYD